MPLLAFRIWEQQVLQAHLPKWRVKLASGIEMNLDFVPQRETGMTAYEMMLSESQERMLIVVKKGREQEIIDLFTKYDLEALLLVK